MSSCTEAQAAPQWHAGAPKDAACVRLLGRRLAETDMDNGVWGKQGEHAQCLTSSIGLYASRKGLGLHLLSYVTMAP